MKLDQSWRPDGSKKGDYVNHERRPDKWAWEFLRRNPEYQADYARWNALPDTEEGDGGYSSWSMKFDRPSWGEFEPMAYFEPCEGFPALNEETFGEYERRTGIAPMPLERALCQKWGMITLSEGDPSRIYTGQQFVTHQRYEVFAPLHLRCAGAKSLFGSSIDPVTSLVATTKMIHANVIYDLGDEDSDEAKYLDTKISSPDYAVFAFDLRIDPKKQTDDVLELLRGMREKRPKTAGGIQPRVLLRRLRILDAVDVANKSQAAVSKMLDLDEAIVSKDLKAARLLVENGYRKMGLID